MNILQLLQEEKDSLPLAFTEARNIALACVIEPCSIKPGCVTRARDENRNTLEMFLSAGVNVFYPYYKMVEQVLKRNSAQRIYQFLPMALLHSKLNRKGGQINMGILEFSLPIVAAHALYDSNSSLTVPELLKRAQEVVDSTTQEDVDNLIRAKLIGQEITKIGRGKTYTLNLPQGVRNVREFYEAELKRELASGAHATGVMHNRQFTASFPDISTTYDLIANATGSISERAAEAYRKMMSTPRNLGLGPGLQADFVAVSLYLHLSNAGQEELIY